jgi:hypothetical protein
MAASPRPSRIGDDAGRPATRRPAGRRTGRGGVGWERATTRVDEGTIKGGGAPCEGGADCTLYDAMATEPTSSPPLLG